MKIGTNNITDVKIGTINVSEIRMGTTLVWQKMAPMMLMESSPIIEEPAPIETPVETKPSMLSSAWKFLVNLFKFR